MIFNAFQLNPMINRSEVGNNQDSTNSQVEALVTIIIGFSSNTIFFTESACILLRFSCSKSNIYGLKLHCSSL